MITVINCLCIGLVYINANAQCLSRDDCGCLTSAWRFICFSGIGEGTSHPMLNKLVKDKVPMKTYCFADEESFVPDHFAYVLEHVADLEEAQNYLEQRGIKKGLDRMAFHMFNSIIPLKSYNCQKLFTKVTKLLMLNVSLIFLYILGALLLLLLLLLMMMMMMMMMIMMMMAIVDWPLAIVD